MRRIHTPLAATLSLLIAGMALTVPVSAQTFPNRPISLIVSYAPGGIADLSSRIVAQGMSQVLGQSVTVENRAGAGGKIGAEAMMRSAKDGYTIALFNHAIASQLPALDATFNIIPGKDYAPIGLFGETYFVLLASAKAPFRTVSEMVAYAKANPGKLSYASTGMGTGSHMGLEALKRAANLFIVHIPYKGEAPALVDVVRGEPELFLGTGSAKAYVADGRLRGLATTGPTRWTDFPDLPTVTEAGIKDYQLKGWFGLAAPAGTPPAVINRLNEALQTAFKDAEMRKKFEALGNVIRLNSPAQFQQYAERELDLYRNVVKFAKIKL